MTGNSSTIFFFLSFFPPFSAASYIIHQLTEYSAPDRHIATLLLSSPFFLFGGVVVVVVPAAFHLFHT
jgi:hypothetical protein